MTAKRTAEERVHPETRAAWRAWLEEHHTRSHGVWLVSYKKATGRPFVPYEDAVTEALCFGWIDSKPRALDDARTMLWYSPRKAGSKWSAPNKRRAEHAIASGLMTAAGLAKIEAARKDGSWTALDAVEALVIPEDLALALDARSQARAHFDAFPRSVKRGILEWIASAKRDETRAKRVNETAALAERNLRANQWRKPST